MSQETAIRVAREQRAQERIKDAYERIIRVASEATSFTVYADVVWRRDAKPPDIDEVADEIDVLMELYASPEFKKVHDDWVSAQDVCREILDEIPEEKMLTDEDQGALRDRFYDATRPLEGALGRLRERARAELT